MSNDKQTPLQFFLMGLVDLEIGKNISTTKEKELHEIYDKSKKQYEDEIINSFSKGYDQGYFRALELMQWKIENELKIKNTI